MTANSRVVVLAFFVVTALFSSLTTGCTCNSSGNALHDFKLEALDGSRFYLSNHRGKIVLVLFWSVHCVPCHRQLGDLSKHPLNRDTSVTIVSVCVDPTDRALVEQGIKITGGRIPALLDHNRALGNKLGIKSEPITLVIDGTGVEISRFVGYDSTTLAQIQKTVAFLKQGALK